MDLLNDIVVIVKDDKEHNIEVRFDTFGISIYLECEPNINDNCIIPIRYTALEEFAYIPQDELIEKFNPNDFGIDLSEIKLIQKIMEYLEKNKEKINAMCNWFDCSYRNNH